MATRRRFQPFCYEVDIAALSECHRVGVDYISVVIQNID
jgi:hypothetical protein